MAIEGIGGGAGQDMMQTMLSAPLKEADLAMKAAKVDMQMQIEGQKMAQAQEVVAQMTGVGGKVDMQI